MLDGIGFVDSINGIRGIATGCSAAFLLAVCLQRQLPSRLVRVCLLLALAAIATSTIAIHFGNSPVNSLGNGQLAIWSAVVSFFAIILIGNRVLAGRKTLWGILAGLLLLGIIGQVLAAFAPESLSKLRFAFFVRTDPSSAASQTVVSAAGQTLCNMLDRFFHAGLLGTSLVYLLVLLLGETKQAILQTPWKFLQALVVFFWIPQTLLASIMIFWGNLSDTTFALAIAYSVARMVIGFVLWQAIRQTADCLEISSTESSLPVAPEILRDQPAAVAKVLARELKRIPWGQAVVAGSIAVLGQILVGFLAAERFWGG